jgi:nucleoside-diphosphate-sugar epimerase
MSGPAAPILVTGATGRHGSTGEHVARRLREEGKPVRILARMLSERTETLAALGAEVVIGDLHDRRSLVTALADVEQAYFTYPVDAGICCRRSQLHGGGSRNGARSTYRRDVNGAGSPASSQRPRPRAVAG